MKTSLISSVFMILTIIYSQNKPPVISATPITSTFEADFYSYPIISSDIDGDSVTISSPILPDRLTLTTNDDGSVAQFNSAQDIDIFGASLFVADVVSQCIRRVDLPAATISSVPSNDEIG